jgi:hypothetical protein
MGPLFVLFRNEVCIFGSVAEPLRFLEAADVRLAVSGAITMNLARHASCAVVGYMESGPRGGFIDAVEFCDPQQKGFLKLCRMDRTDRGRWLSLLADYHVEAAPAARIAGIRKTNHLEVPISACGPASPAEAMLDRFFECALRCEAALEITAPASGARGRLMIRPTHRMRAGHWIVLSSDETAFHLAPGCVSELRIVTRPHLIQLVLFGAGGRFVSRILSRDSGLISQFNHIL